MKQNLGTVVILVNSNQVLLGKRKQSCHGEGMFGFPGGRLIENEQLVDCMKRELMEEVGVVPTEYRLLGVVKEWQESDFFIHFVFMCTQWQGEIQLREPEKCEEWKWYNIKNLPIPLLKGHQLALDLLGNEQQNWLVEA